MTAEPRETVPATDRLPYQPEQNEDAMMKKTKTTKTTTKTEIRAFPLTTPVRKLWSPEDDRLLISLLTTLPDGEAIVREFNAQASCQRSPSALYTRTLDLHENRPEEVPEHASDILLPVVNRQQKALREEPYVEVHGDERWIMSELALTRFGITPTYLAQLAYRGHLRRRAIDGTRRYWYAERDIEAYVEKTSPTPPPAKRRAPRRAKVAEVVAAPPPPPSVPAKAQAGIRREDVKRLVLVAVDALALGLITHEELEARLQKMAEE